MALAATSPSAMRRPPSSASRTAPAPKPSPARRTAIAARSGCQGRDCRQGPPKLFDLPALQKTCGQRWGWTADKTLVHRPGTLRWRWQEANHLSERRSPYLSENQIADVPAITAALTRLRGFAHLDLSKPVIRRASRGISATARWKASRIMPSCQTSMFSMTIGEAARASQRRRKAAVRTSFAAPTWPPSCRTSSTGRPSSR